MIAAAERHKVSGALGVSGEPGAVVMWDTADTLPTCRQWKERFLRLLRTTAITHEKKRSEGKNRLEVWSHFEPSPNEDKTSKSSVKEQEATEHSNLSPFQCFSSDVSRCNWNYVFRFLWEEENRRTESIEARTRTSSKLNPNVPPGLEIESSGWKKVLKLKIKRSSEILCLTPALFFAFTLKEYVLPGRSPATVHILSQRWWISLNSVNVIRRTITTINKLYSATGVCYTRVTLHKDFRH